MAEQEQLARVSIPRYAQSFPMCISILITPTCTVPQKTDTNLPLKRQTKNAADNILIFYFYLLKKIKLDVSCESSA